MREAHFTRQERILIQWLRFLTFYFVGGVLIIAFFPNLFLQYINDIGFAFLGFPNLGFEAVGWDAWRLLSLALLAVLTSLTFLSQRDWLTHCRFVPPVIFAKGLCALGFPALYFLTTPHFFYLMASVADGLLFLLTWYYYAQAIHSRPTITPHGS